MVLSLLLEEITLPTTLGRQPAFGLGLCAARVLTSKAGQSCGDSLCWRSNCKSRELKPNLLVIEAPAHLCSSRRDGQAPAFSSRTFQQSSCKCTC
jgi:hypothetical protein